MLSTVDPPRPKGAAARLGRIAAAGVDDSAEVDVFVREHWPQAYRAAYLLLRDRQRAEDVAQETVLSALDRRGSLDTSRPLRPWIERVAANHALDLLRSAEARRTVATDQADAAPESAVADDASTDPALTHALSSLRPDDRAAVVLRYVLGHGVPEVAELLGINEGATRTRLHRALSRLRRELEEGRTDDARD